MKHPNMMLASDEELNWGYSGGGPSELALRLLCDYLKDEERARRICCEFCDSVIAKLPNVDFVKITPDDRLVKLWELTDSQMQKAIAECEG